MASSKCAALACLRVHYGNDPSFETAGLQINLELAHVRITQQTCPDDLNDGSTKRLSESGRPKLLGS